MKSREMIAVQASMDQASRGAPLSWLAVDRESFSGRMLERPTRTQLAMTARYTPPFGLLGRVADRGLLHRVAEATVKDFVDRVGEALQGRLAHQPGWAVVRGLTP